MKLMDDSIIRIPKTHFNAETVAVGRYISLVLVLIHRLHQLLSANKNIDRYPDLLHYRHAASNRATFHDTILKCRSIFKKELDTMKDNAQQQSQPPPSSPIRQQRRNLRRQRVDGVIPERVDFASTLNIKTPKKITALTKNGKAPVEVCDMVTNCTGMIMKSYPVKYHRCNLCSKQTAWYCAGCKRWLCMDRRALQENQKELNLYCHQVKQKELSFSKVCYHTAHEAAWRKNKVQTGRVGIMHHNN